MARKRKHNLSSGSRSRRSKSRKKYFYDDDYDDDEYYDYYKDYDEKYRNMTQSKDEKFWKNLYDKHNYTVSVGNYSSSQTHRFRPTLDGTHSRSNNLAFHTPMYSLISVAVMALYWIFHLRWKGF